MSEDEQRIAIAKLCGWVFHPEGNPPSVPDYLHDLNAIHQAVARLISEQYDADLDGFTYHLARVVHGLDADDVGWNFYELQEATAAQRAEALLRTIGKWKD